MVFFLLVLICHKELKHHSGGFIWLWRNKPSYPAFLTIFSSPQDPFPRSSECFQETWHRYVLVSSIFQKKLLQIWLDPEVRGLVMPTEAFSEKNSGLMQAKWEILQNWFYSGEFPGWKGLQHMTSDGYKGKCSQCWYSSQKCWLFLRVLQKNPFMFISTVSVKVAVWPRTFNCQHDWDLCEYCSHFSVLHGEEIGWPLFQLIREPSFHFGFVSSVKWTHCLEHSLQYF